MSIYFTVICGWSRWMAFVLQYVCVTKPDKAQTGQFLTHILSNWQSVLLLSCIACLNLYIKHFCKESLVWGICCCNKSNLNLSCLTEIDLCDYQWMCWLITWKSQRKNNYHFFVLWNLWNIINESTPLKSRWARNFHSKCIFLEVSQPGALVCLWSGPKSRHRRNNLMFQQKATLYHS